MPQDRRTVVGAVEFTAQGVVITKTYNTPDELQLERVEFNSGKFMSYLKARIDHCEKSLNENIMRATYISEDFVLWDGGRFSRIMYKTMKDFVSKYDRLYTSLELLKRDPHFKGCCQEVIKHLYDNKIEDKDMFYTLTEIVLCA